MVSMQFKLLKKLKMEKNRFLNGVLNLSLEKITRLKVKDWPLLLKIFLKLNHFQLKGKDWPKDF